MLQPEMSAHSPARAAATGPLIPSPKRENGYSVGPATQLIIKDVGEIHSRLLDHRPIIQGETRYFIKEFEVELHWLVAETHPEYGIAAMFLFRILEDNAHIQTNEKRGHREVRVLENVKNSVSEASGQVLPKCTDVMQDQLGLVLKSLETANHAIHRLQQREQEIEKSNNATKMRHEKLRSQWETFMKEQEQRQLAIDEEHNKAVLRLKEQYAQMNRELSKMASF